MEVYKITNKRTGQVYVGSTIYTKEVRWSNGKSGHKDYIEWGYRTCKFYIDVIDNKDLDNLVLETIEVCNDLSVHDLRLREDYWIKYYWDMLGESMMYNTVRSAWTESDASQMHTDKVYDTIRSNHGGVLAWNTPESYEKQRIVKSSKLLYDDCVFIGIQTLTNYLKSTYDSRISYSSVERIADGCLVKRYKSLYGLLRYLSEDEYNNLVQLGKKVYSKFENSQN